jgi:hypothetical protein
MWSRTEEACKQRVTELERDAQYFPVYAQRHIDEVIKTEVDIDVLLAGFESLWDEVNRRLSILTFLHRSRRLREEDMSKAFAAIRHNLIEDSAAVDAWRRAIETLQNDPDAELP